MLTTSETFPPVWFRVGGTAQTAQFVSSTDVFLRVLEAESLSKGFSSAESFLPATSQPDSETACWLPFIKTSIPVEWNPLSGPS